MSSNDVQGAQAPTDYEALNNTFYSIVDSWLPKDFGHKAVQQTDADVLFKIRKAKEKERHRYVFRQLCSQRALLIFLPPSASNLENGNASTSSIPHANLLKRKLQSGGSQPNTANASEGTATETAADDESEEESRTRSIAKKSKTGYDAFSKAGKAKSKGKQKENGSGSTVKTGAKGEEDDTSKTANTSSANGQNGTHPLKSYNNPFAMPSAVDSNMKTETNATPEPTPTPTTDTIPSRQTTQLSTDTSTPDADGLSKNQRKKQRKKEKKALAREESAKLQQDALGKLAVAQP